jgi:lysophospholipase L1-like esterase
MKSFFDHASPGVGAGALLLIAIASLGGTGFVSAQPSSPVRVVLVGDSTVTDDAGWGAGFARLKNDAVEVINMAASGRSSKSFVDEGIWARALAQKGKYYVIQFGHNDEPGKGLERETDPATTFRGFMERYVDDARAIGATPVLVTSLIRRLYGPDGRIHTTQTPYVEVVRAVAAEKHVALIDLHAISLADAENAGDDVWAGGGADGSRAPARRGPGTGASVPCAAVAPLDLQFRRVRADTLGRGAPRLCHRETSWWWKTTRTR